MSTHPISASHTNGAPDASPPLDLIYTNFLIYNGRSFATDYDQESYLFSLQALGNESTMLQAGVARRQWDLLTYNNADETLDLDVCTWEEGRQILEDYDWSSLTSPNGEQGVQVDDV